MPDYCCDTMREALTEYDGPFFTWTITGQIGVALYHLTPSKKAISRATGSRRYMPIANCPFCGEELSECPTE